MEPSRLASRIYKGKDRFHKGQARLSAKKKLELLDRMMLDYQVLKRASHAKSLD